MSGSGVDIFPQGQVNQCLVVSPAEETGNEVVATASLPYSAQIYKARGNTAKYQAKMEKLRQKTLRSADTKTPLPKWLLDEINQESGL